MSSRNSSASAAGKPGGRFVEQEKARIDGERPREPDPAFFAVAQTGRRPMRLIGEVKLAENLARAPARFGAGKPLPHIADLDILAHAEPAKEPHGLEGPHHAGARKAVARQACAIAFADDDRADLRPLESGQHIDQRRLAGAVRSDEAENFPALQRDADLIDGDEAAEPDAHRLRR